MAFDKITCLIHMIIRCQMMTCLFNVQWYLFFQNFPCHLSMDRIIDSEPQLLFLLMSTLAMMNLKPDRLPTSRTLCPYSTAWSASPTLPFPLVLLPEHDDEPGSAGDGEFQVLQKEFTFLVEKSRASFQSFTDIPVSAIGNVPPELIVCEYSPTQTWKWKSFEFTRFPDTSQVGRGTWQGDKSDHLAWSFQHLDDRLPGHEKVCIEVC